MNHTMQGARWHPTKKFTFGAVFIIALALLLFGWTRSASADPYCNPNTLDWSRAIRIESPQRLLFDLTENPLQVVR